MPNYREKSCAHRNTQHSYRMRMFFDHIRKAWAGAPTFESHPKEVATPFAVFQGWVTTTVSIMGPPRHPNSRFLDCADRFTIRSARNDRVVKMTDKLLLPGIA